MSQPHCIVVESRGWLSLTNGTKSLTSRLSVIEIQHRSINREWSEMKANLPNVAHYYQNLMIERIVQASLRRC